MVSRSESEHAYRPPKSYWKEVDRLNGNVRVLSSPTSNLRMGPFSFKRRHTVWLGHEQSSFNYWIDYRYFPTANMTHLSMCHAIGIDPLEEDLPTSNTKARIGVMATHFSFASAENGLVRLAQPGDRGFSLNKSFVPDIDRIQDQQPVFTRESRRLDKKMGLARPDATTYDVLLHELQRGASGEHAPPQDDSGNYILPFPE